MVSTKINRGLAFLFILQVFSINPRLFFILSCGYFLILIKKSDLRVYYARIPGMNLYLIFILYSAVLGLASSGLRNIARDLFYVLGSVIWIFIGLQIKEDNAECSESLMKTLIFYGGAVSLKCFVDFFLTGSFDFQTLRSTFGTNVYDVGMILPILLYYCCFCRKTVFSKRTDRILAALMTMQILLSFGRMAILEPLLVCTVMISLNWVTGDRRSRALKGLMALFGFLTVGCIALFCILPESVSETFIGKVLNTFREINSSQEITSVGMAMGNWRAYEIQATMDAWKSGKILTQIFGNGMGTGTLLEFVPYNWGETLDGSRLPLAHNGFMTLLSKGGILAVAALALLFLGAAADGVRWMRNKGTRDAGIILAAISIAGIANTWVVRGPVKQGSFLVWALLLGYYYRNYSFVKKEGLCARDGKERNE